jgi:hypothetical protein
MTPWCSKQLPSDEYTGHDSPVINTLRSFSRLYLHDSSAMNLHRESRIPVVNMHWGVDYKYRMIAQIFD